MDEQDAKIQALPEDTPEEERGFHAALFAKYQEEAERRAETLERLVAIQEARSKVPTHEKADDDEPEARKQIRVVGEPLTYRQGAPFSYFRDLVLAEHRHNVEARERLLRHGKEMIVEKRDVTSGDPGAGTFIPPIYLGARWIDEEVAGRPLANACQSIPLSPTGNQMDFPRVATAPAVEVQAQDADAVQETDFDGETYSVSKVTIAGQNDVSVQALEFSDPSIDTVIMRELVKSYNSKLDTQLLSGQGSSGEHRGLRNVSSINTETFSSGGADDLLGKIYSAVSQVATNAPGYEANAVVMHPRRAAWMASHRDANGNLFQQGQLFLASGGQDQGFVGNVAGLRVIRDSNIATTLGTGTNEDEIYVVDVDELYLAEGALRTRVLAEVLSGTLQVRVQLYAFSAFAGGRRPKVITRISGAGLASPTFPST